MAAISLPLIDREDYTAFRRVLHMHLPATFDEWLYLHSVEMADIVESGNTAHDVRVHSSDFAGYCDLTRSTRDLPNLALFTEGTARVNRSRH
jgi:hypothetical protein